MLHAAAGGLGGRMKPGRLTYLNLRNRPETRARAVGATAVGAAFEAAAIITLFCCVLAM